MGAVTRIGQPTPEFTSWIDGWTEKFLNSLSTIIANSWPPLPIKYDTDHTPISLIVEGRAQSEEAPVEPLLVGVGNPIDVLVKNDIEHRVPVESSETAVIVKNTSSESVPVRVENDVTVRGTETDEHPVHIAGAVWGHADREAVKVENKLTEVDGVIFPKPLLVLAAEFDEHHHSKTLDVHVTNKPKVDVDNEPYVNLHEPVKVNIGNVPDVHVTNTAADPVEVSVNGNIKLDTTSPISVTGSVTVSGTVEVDKLPPVTLSDAAVLSVHVKDPIEIASAQQITINNGQGNPVRTTLYVPIPRHPEAITGSSWADDCYYAQPSQAHPLVTAIVGLDNGINYEMPQQSTTIPRYIVDESSQWYCANNSRLVDVFREEHGATGRNVIAVSRPP